MMATPAINRQAFGEMQRNAQENSLLAQQHQQAMGVIQSQTKTASFDSKNSMTSINDTADLVASPLNQAYKSA